MSRARPWPQPWRALPVEVFSPDGPDEFLDRLGLESAAHRWRVFVPDFPRQPERVDVAPGPDRRWRVYERIDDPAVWAYAWRPPPRRNRGVASQRQLRAEVRPVDGGGSVLRGRLRMPLHNRLLAAFWLGFVAALWFHEGLAGWGLDRMRHEVPSQLHPLFATLVLGAFFVVGFVILSLAGRSFAENEAFLLGWLGHAADPVERG